ncbi:unnamed protein product [Parajaminaea phylloscopi]
MTSQGEKGQRSSSPPEPAADRDAQIRAQIAALQSQLSTATVSQPGHEHDTSVGGNAAVQQSSETHGSELPTYDQRGPDSYSSSAASRRALEEAQLQDKKAFAGERGAIPPGQGEQAVTNTPSSSRAVVYPPAQPPLPHSSSSASSSSGTAVPQAEVDFGSPYANNSQWSPAPADYMYRQLPPVGNFVDRIKRRFARSSGNPLDSPSPSFRRPAPAPGSPAWDPRLREAPPVDYTRPFEPMVCPTKMTRKPHYATASDGFQPYYTGCELTRRDVSAADWERFLEDIEIAGSLTGGAKIFATVAPLTSYAGLTGFRFTRNIEKNMKGKKEPQIVTLVESWMASFFRVRNLDVYIVKDGVRMTALAPGELPPPLDPGVAQRLRGNPAMIALARTDTGSSSSSSSSSAASVEAGRRFPNDASREAWRKERRRIKRERRDLKRAHRDERRAHKRAMRDLKRSGRWTGKERQVDELALCLVCAPLQGTTTAASIAGTASMGGPAAAFPPLAEASSAVTAGNFYSPPVGAGTDRYAPPAEGSPPTSTVPMPEPEAGTGAVPPPDYQAATSSQKKS